MLSFPDRTWRILDLGAGGGDIALWITKTCRSKGLKVKVLCLDHDPRVVEYAKKQTRHDDNIQVLCASVLDSQWTDVKFDYILAIHLLHHLRTSEVTSLLKKIDQTCQRIFLINDVLRSPWSYLAFTLIAALLLRGSFAYIDGRISIRKGFRPLELRQIIRQADIQSQINIARIFAAHVYIVGTVGNNKNDDSEKKRSNEQR